MLIRPLVQNDYPAIESLAHAIWGNDGAAKAKRPKGWDREKFTVGSYQYSANADMSKILVAEQDGRLVGAAAVTGNASFPRHFLRISVHPEFRRQGIGTALFQNITEPERYRYFTREWLDDNATIPFYESVGCTEGERVTEGWIYPRNPETANWIKKALNTVPEHIIVLEQSDPECKVTALEIARFMDNDFVRHQSWVPVSPQSNKQALQMFLGSAIEGSLFCAFIKGELRAVANLSEPIFEPDAESIHFWRTALAATEEDALDLLKTVTAHCLKLAADRGLKVQVEQTDRSPFQRKVLYTIPGTDLIEDMCLMICG